MKNEPVPIFLLSLPRSGSTLVQRLLATSEQVATASEPWVLLPLFYGLKKQGIFTEYDHDTAKMAVDDFLSGTPDGRELYFEAVRSFAVTLYEGAGGKGHRFFLDKTPRYSLIMPEILAAFPNAKFVVLWRNPLAVIASLITTFGGGFWNLYKYRVDLYDGLRNLIQESRSDRAAIYSIRYEELIANPEEVIEGLGAYLGIEFEPDKVLALFPSIELAGRMGDATGTKEYGSIDRRPVDKWKKVLANPYRRRWARKYLQWIDQEDPGFMGYDRAALLAELEQQPQSWRYLLSDLALAAYGFFYCLLELPLFRKKARWSRAGTTLKMHR